MGLNVSYGIKIEKSSEIFVLGTETIVPTFKIIMIMYNINIINIITAEHCPETYNIIIILVFNIIQKMGFDILSFLPDLCCQIYLSTLFRIDA